MINGAYQLVPEISYEEIIVSGRKTEGKVDLRD
jgi:hypothetical protein